MTKKTQLKNGNQIILRKPKLEDATKMNEYYNQVGGESDNLLYGKNEYHLNEEQQINNIKKINSDENSFMILACMNDNILGIGMIHNFINKRIAHNSQIYLSVKKDYWGLGLGTAILQEIVNFANTNPIIKNISLGVKATNENAIKMYEKLGFIKVGVNRNYFNVDGVIDDKIIMDLYLDN